MQVRVKVTKEVSFTKLVEVDDLIANFSDEIDFALKNSSLAAPCTHILTIADESEFIDVDGTEVHKDLSIFKP